MVFPLPKCPEYRKLMVTFWLDDIDDRLRTNHKRDAEKSWKIANEIYLSLPPGKGDPEIENWLFAQRVKLDYITNTTNENNLQRLGRTDTGNQEYDKTCPPNLLDNDQRWSDNYRS